jgi:hypothetical protein
LGKGSNHQVPIEVYSTENTGNKRLLAALVLAHLIAGLQQIRVLSVFVLTKVGLNHALPKQCLCQYIHILFYFN